MKTAPLLGILGGSVLLTGCSVSGSTGQSCDVTAMTLTVMPSSATADHAATAPGNQLQFYAQVSRTFPQGCPLPPYAAFSPALWSTSDPTDIQIISFQNPGGQGNGLATCLGSTKSPATVTAVYTQDNLTASGTGTLTCK